MKFFLVKGKDKITLNQLNFKYDVRSGWISRFILGISHSFEVLFKCRTQSPLGANNLQSLVIQHCFCIRLVCLNLY